MWTEIFIYVQMELLKQSNKSAHGILRLSYSYKASGVALHHQMVLKAP